MESAKEPAQAVPFSSPFLPSTRRWWSKETVAIVTGANRGIGFALVQRLAELGLTVILTARDSERGHCAAQALRAQGLHVHFLSLDVSDPASIKTFVALFRMKFGTLDILRLLKSYIDPVLLRYCICVDRSTARAAGSVLHASFDVCRLPLLVIPEHYGFCNIARNETILNQIYATAPEFRLKKVGRDISVNCFCPGFTQTSMTGGKGKHTAEGAADVGARLLLLPPQELPTGKFFVGSGSSSTTTF
ncbi:hypothetical protein F2P56_015729, partial [Juglans regia]